MAVMGKTHLIAAPAITLSMIQTGAVSKPLDIGVVLCCSAFGTLWPDIDTTSKISQEDIVFGAISQVVRRFWKHRGPTHTVWFAALSGLAAWGLGTLAVGWANSSIAFLIAALMFLIIHAQAGAQKFGSLVAIAIYFAVPYILPHLPFSIPTFTISISAKLIGFSVFLGCVGHMLWDTFCKEGIMWLHPISKHRFSLAPITTSSPAESVFAAVTSIATAAWAVFLIHTGVIHIL